MVRYDSAKEGAILSFRSIEALSPTPQHQQDFIRLGYRTDMMLSDIKTKNPEVKAVIDKAGIYALSSNPILLYEKTGAVVVFWHAASTTPVQDTMVPLSVLTC